MPLSQQQAGILRQNYLDKREELLQKKVDSLALSLFDKIFKEYLSALEQSNGKLVNNGKNIKKVNGLDAIYNQFNKNENIPVVKSFVKDLQGITPLNQAYFKTVSTKPTTAAAKRAIEVVNNTIGIGADGKLVSGGFADKFIKDDSLVKKIKKQTLQAITQQKGFQQFKEELQRSIVGEDGKPLSGGLQQYYRTYAYDTFHKVDRVNADVFAGQLGLIYFYWAGGLIKSSRALCIVANGKIFNSLQLSKMSYDTLEKRYRDGITKGWVPLLDLGMWNCRHRKDFISDEMAAKHMDKWFDLNTISTKPIADRNPRILNDAQKKEYKKFPKDESLTGANAKLQDDSIKFLITNKKALTNEYVQRFGNVANTDDARKMFTEIGYNGENASAVHEAASALNKAAIKSMITNSKSNQIEMFAGGAGSGKTSAIGLLKPDLKSSAAAIIDGNMSAYESAINKINQFLTDGKQVNISYVYRAPEDAWVNGVIKRMLDNPEEMGRVVPLKTFLQNTSGAYNTVKLMLDNGFDNTNGVNIDIIDNSLGRGNTDYMDIEKFNKVVFDDALKADLLKVTKGLLDSGKITRAQYEALIAE